MLSEPTRTLTRAEWRDLGFFYDRDDAARRWRLVGARAGLRRFPELLRTYALRRRSATTGEHDHFGPYMYLKVMTWADAGIDGDSIHGTPEDLRRLAVLAEGWLETASPGETVDLAPGYAAGCSYGLDLELRPDGFDPAAEDGALW